MAAAEISARDGGPVGVVTGGRVCVCVSRARSGWQMLASAVVWSALMLGSSLVSAAAVYRRMCVARADGYQQVPSWDKQS